MFATLQGRGAIGHCLRTDRGLEKRAREERGRSRWGWTIRLWHWGEGNRGHFQGPGYGSLPRLLSASVDWGIKSSWSRSFLGSKEDVEYFLPSSTANSSPSYLLSNHRPLGSHNCSACCQSLYKTFAAIQLASMGTTKATSEPTQASKGKEVS